MCLQRTGKACIRDEIRKAHIDWPEILMSSCKDLLRSEYLEAAKENCIVLFSLRLQSFSISKFPIRYRLLHCQDMHDEFYDAVIIISSSQIPPCTHPGEGNSNGTISIDSSSRRRI